MKTIVALFDDLPTARRVLDDLDAAGLRSDFTMMGAANARSTAMAGGTADFDTDYDDPRNRVAVLERAGVPRDDAQIYAEGVRRGGVLVMGRVDDRRCDDALDVIERHGSIDIGERGRSYRESGWTGYDAASTDYDQRMVDEERTRYGTGTGAAAASLRDVNTGATGSGAAGTTGMGAAGMGAAAATGEAATGREEHIPIVEEEVHVGKRAVERGHLRVRSYTVETPVEETVNLRDETIHVERRAVDAPGTPVPEDAFRERNIEVTETDEEAVVAKEARVREELVVRKDVEQHRKTVSDTVRRTEVEVEDDRAGGTGRTTDPKRGGV